MPAEKLGVIGFRDVPKHAEVVEKTSKRIHVGLGVVLGSLTQLLLNMSVKVTFVTFLNVPGLHSLESGGDQRKSAGADFGVDGDYVSVPRLAIWWFCPVLRKLAPNRNQPDGLYRLLS
jgi:hypothetical protein